jgi:biopolymer transport protein ExbD
MDAIEQSPHRAERKAGVPKMKRQAVKTDMTPMVDLGFLLIAFFVMTTELNKPSVIDLAMPTDKSKQRSELGESYALTVLLGENKRVFYYHGSWERASGTVR